MTNKLFYGDNLDVLRNRDHFPDGLVDLVYLDPPFNSNASYNILFRSPAGVGAASRIEAFEDTWHWNDTTSLAFHEVMASGNTELANMLRAMHGFLGENDMMAYLAMMAVRLLELHRVLKPTGSLYLHCDPTASHYLKLLLDAIFGKENFRNEIYWHYYNKMHDLRKKLFAKATDTILFYVKDVNSEFTFHHMKEVRDKPFKQLVRKKVEGRLINARDEDGRLMYRMKDDKHIDNVWRFPMLQPASPERLGYPTQKPLGLLERVLSASSNEGDLVLDPFCGCGTTIHAAQRLERRWLGIDITHLAIGLIERRLDEAFPGIRYEVVGDPKDLASAERLAAEKPHQFQYWVTQKIGGQPYQGGRGGMDRGIDGYIYFTRAEEADTGVKPSTQAAIVSVKAGRNVGVAMIRDLKGVMERESAPIGIFVCVADPTRELEREAAAAGVYVDPYTKQTYPRLQIFRLAELFQGRLPGVPLLDRRAGYRQARREETGRQGELI